MNSYNKPPLSIQEQAQLLLDKGLICEDKDRLERYLSTIGYYRLSVYWSPFLSQDKKQFIPDTTFDKILKIYIFDRKLRLLVMEALERIEVALRAKWSCTLALVGGSHAYTDETIFENVIRKNKQNEEIIIRQYSDVWKELENKFKELHFDNPEKSPENFLQHYKNNYCDPNYPPIWMVTEVMTFGMLSRWFQLTKNKVINKQKKEVAIKKDIIKSFGMPNSIYVFENTLHHLTIVRNICAHHSRLWNRCFVFYLPKIYKINGKNAENRFVYNENRGTLDNRLYNSLVVTEALLHSINPHSTWKNRLIELIKSIDDGDINSMGFPDDWKEREPWKN